MFDVTAEDIRDAGFGLTIPAGEAVDKQLVGLVAKAKARLLALVPSLPRRVTAGTLDEQTVKGVIEDMVLRVVKNPRALRQLGIDDFQATIDTAVSSGALYLTPDERLLLSPKRRRAIGSVQIGVPRWRLPGA